MLRPLAVAAVCTSAAALVAGAVVTLVPTAASAGTDCTAWAAMPSAVALGPHATTIRMTLRGSAGCTDAASDNGATADLRGPGADDPQRWSRFGTDQDETFTVGVNRPGRYVMHDGDVQVYNSQEERVPSTWRPTEVTVRYAARFRHVHREGATVTASLARYGTSGWTAGTDTTVVLERHTASGWRPVARERAGRGGTVRFTGLQGHYRLVSDRSETVAAARSRTV